MLDCIFSPNSNPGPGSVPGPKGRGTIQSETFFEKWNISKDCLIKSYCKDKNCVNLDHIYVSKVDIKNLEKYLHTDEKECRIWLGRLTNDRPFYNTQDLRNYVYGEILKGYAVSVSCGNNRCLNIHHLYLSRKIDNLKTFLVKLNLEKAKEIRSLWAAGASPVELSEKYKITKQAISLILNNRSWFDNEYTPKSRTYKWTPPK